MNLISFFQGRKLFFSLLIIFSIIKIIDHAITNVSKLAVILQVMVFNIDLLICDAIFQL